VLNLSCPDNIFFILLQKRVSSVKREYTYIGIKDTPFAIGIVLPSGYGTKIAQPEGNKIRNLLTTMKISCKLGNFCHISDLK
jgi:hypothetical protein